MPRRSESQRSILDALKREGAATVPELARSLGLNIETVREHLRTLTQQGLVRRAGSRRRGRGRPEVVHALTPAAEGLFPRREAETLRELGAYLVSIGEERVLRDFFKQAVASRRKEALERVRGLEGRERLEEVARIFSELGYMAEVHTRDGVPELRLCHCPIRALVDATNVPCGAEIRLMTELWGERLTRATYIPAGHATCSYRAR